MLVISRKRGQQVVISEDIKVTVLEISRSRIKLGVEAPREIPVHREETALHAAPRPPGLQHA